MLRILIGIPLNLPTLNPEDVFEPCPALIYLDSRKGGISLTVSLVAVVLLLRRCRLLLFFRIVTGPLSYFLSFPFADTISRVQPKKTSAVGRLLLKIRRDSLVHTGSGHPGWRGRRGGKGAPRGGGRGGCVLLAGLVRGSKHLWN